MQRRDLLKFVGALAAGRLSAQTQGLSHSRVGTSPLKITEVEAFVIRTPNDGVAGDKVISMAPVGAMTGGIGLWNRLDHSSPSRSRGHTQAVLVKIATDQGLSGWGECHAPEAPRVHQTIIRDLFGPILIGQDARDIEPLWEKLYSAERLRGYSDGFYTESLAGVDLALWDIFGKYAGLPVYRLLGGKFRETVPTYLGIGGASVEALKENAVKAIEQGFTVMKMSLSKGHGTYDLGRVAAAAEAIRGKGQLLVDSLGAYKLFEAMKVGRELDRLGDIGWWEDPLAPDDMPSYPKLAESLDTAITVGEELCNKFQFRDLLVSGGADIVNPDICRADGITALNRITAMADAHSVLWAPHISTGTAVYFSASLQLAVSTPNFIIMEGGNLLDSPFGNRLLKEPIEHKPGSATVPERPGLGIEFDEAELAKVRAG
ncbi:MAG TPA: mandelate racemase/muconate lactonizing enzyme family protein [Bryobacteraceae bacterium]|nr:mandelate racemase/muconate lactonizing enzyme family protein [Bryobacteraceae bacterium]